MRGEGRGKERREEQGGCVRGGRRGGSAPPPLNIMSPTVTWALMGKPSYAGKGEKAEKFVPFTNFTHLLILHSNRSEAAGLAM